MRLFRVLSAGVLSFALLSAARGEYVRGEINGWANNYVMTADTTFGGVFAVTVPAYTNDTSAEFKFDRNGAWGLEQWGKPSGATEATKNGTIGNARYDGGSPPNLAYSQTNGFRYTFRLAGASTDWFRDYVVMETSADPVNLLAVISTVSQSTGAVPTAIQSSAALSASERIWVRYSTNDFASSLLLPSSGSSTNYSVSLPAQVAGTRAYFYVLTSTMPSNVITANPNLCTLRGKISGATNYGFRYGTMNAWHFPTNAEPAGATMRNPATNGMAPSTPVYFYSGSQTGGTGNAANQSGMSLVHRLRGTSGWTTNAGAFDSGTAFNQYWAAIIPGNTYAATNVVEYYLRVTATDHNTTYIGTNISGSGQALFLAESLAQAAPYVFVYGSATNLGNCWHYPANTEPPGATMRNPLAPTHSQTVFLYNGNQFQGPGNAGDQSGGTVYYRKVGAGGWNSTNLSFDSTQGDNKYWVTGIPGGTYAAGDTVEYYLRITYNDRATTFIGTTNNGTANTLTALESFAQTNTFTFTYSANPGNAWHLPANAEPPGAYMRNPRYPFTNSAVYLYNGNQFAGAGTTGDQTGGVISHRLVGGGGWTTNALSFDSQQGNNKYWYGVIPAGAYQPTNEVEYYFKLTYADRDTTYLGTTNSGAGSLPFTSEASAQANPFRFTYGGQPGTEAGYIWHNSNRVNQGSGTVQFWAKIGYAQGTGSNRWVDQVRLYYTTNGAAVGVAGKGTGDVNTLVKVLDFSHTEEDGGGQGNAMWWQGTVTGLPQTGNIRYKIGAWNGAGAQRFAEYNTEGQDNKEFVFSLFVSGADGLTVNGKNADYTTTKFFVDERAGDSYAVNVQYTIPGGGTVEKAEVFSNLDRRDYADVDINGDSIPDGIKPPLGNSITTNDTGAYFRAYPMTLQGGRTYGWTGTASKSGAYRLTARYKLQSDTNWYWYSSDGRRDHAIVVSPKKSLEMTLYEVNPLTVKATANSFGGRSTFSDMLSGNLDSFTNFNLGYLNKLQVNCLWFQPIHPSAATTRGDPSGYDPGSPYATRDYFAVASIMGEDNTEAGALAEFTNFVHRCDTNATSVGTINIMLDGVFNHTAWDAVMGQGGVDLGFAASPGQTMPGTRPGWYSYWQDYGQPANFYNGVYDNDIATAPDRGDFGKWDDVAELYFGKYSALVRNNPANNGDYTNEGDTYDFAGMTADTAALWKYFGYYTEYWLKKTGHPTNNLNAAYDDYGIDALRCDFGQGLPPQLWEYIINRTRKMKWNFVFMAETLDGGVPGYRSNRHFDILNENLVFRFTQEKINQSWQLRQALEDRRNAYSGGAVLLNLTGHDEVMPDNDPWVVASRYGAVSAVDGLPMLFYGQEWGIGLFNPADPDNPNDGFLHSHELNFGKYIPHFKQWNKLTVWEQPPAFSDGLAQWHGRVNWARLNSPALQSQNRYFLNKVGGGEEGSIFAVAKYQTAYAAPATSDVVLAFALFLRHGEAHFSAAATFDLQGPWSLLGLDTGKTYRVRNLASSDASAYIASGWPRSGQDLFNNGIYVQLGGGTLGPAITADGQLVQYLKLEEYTATNAAPVINLPGPHILALGSSTSFPVTVSDANGNPVTTNFVSGPAGSAFSGGLFSWTASPTNFVNTTNWVVFSADDGQGATNSVVTNTASIVVPFDFDGDGLGDDWEIGYYATLTNAPGGDTDEDGVPNGDEYVAGTLPTSSNSFFRVQTMAFATTNRLITVPTVGGRRYQAWYADQAYSNQTGWQAFGNTNDGYGTWLETNPAGGTRSFVDDQTTNSTFGPPAGGQRTYRVTVEGP